MRKPYAFKNNSNYIIIYIIFTTPEDKPRLMGCIGILKLDTLIFDDDAIKCWHQTVAYIL